jgi:dynein heavy chain
VLNSQNDPQTTIFDVARKQKVAVESITLGHPQHLPVATAMREAAKRGTWLLIQNLHLDLLCCRDEIQKTLEAMIYQAEHGAEKVSPKERIEVMSSARFWLVTQPLAQFPIGILNISMKVFVEPPIGLRVGLRQAYSWLQQFAPDTIEYIDHPRWRTLLFALCLCHTVLHERSRLGMIGFTVPYELGGANLMYAIDTLRELAIDPELKKNASLIWAPLRYMVSEVLYGSAMLSEWDQNIISTYAHGYFQPNLVETGNCLLPNLVLPVGQATDKYLAFVEKLPVRDYLKHCGLSNTLSMPIHQTQLDLFIRVLESHDGLIVKKGAAPAEGVGSILDEANQLLMNLSRATIDQQCRTLSLQKEKSSTTPGTDPGQSVSVQNFVRDEAVRMAHIISVVRGSLESLVHALEKQKGWTIEVVALTEHISSRTVPPSWSSLCWGAESMSQWWTHLIKSIEQLIPWSNMVRPKAVWLGGLLFPARFLHAVTEESTMRLQRWPLAEAVMYSEVKSFMYEEIEDPPDVGVYVHGLVLEGASWDVKQMKLAECLPLKSHDELPIVWFHAVKQGDQLLDAPYLRLPLYMTRNRASRFISAMYVRSCGDLPKWTLRGTAVLSTLSVM